VRYPKIGDLVGKTLVSIKGAPGEDRMVMQASDGSVYALYHSPDCCESVDIESIVGDLNDLIGEPLLMAEEVTHENVNPEGVKTPEYSDESFTWTFYKFATRKGYVDVRWYGSSNGYYSENVAFAQLVNGSAMEAK
jgi:hypothetical protein